MLLGEPPQTQYDLNFSILGFPVRVHPFFWLAAFILGSRGASGEDAGLLLLIWVVALFVSILVHELGHSLMMRRFGISSHIVLHMMGGLAIPDSFGFGARSNDSRTSILISFAGPAAGFLFAALIVLVILATGGRFQIDPSHFPFYRFALNVAPGPEINPWEQLTHALLYINIFWGLVNLLPVYPLDGGQIARTVMIDQDPGRGAINSLWLSVFAGAGMAVVGYAVLHSFFVLIMFGMLAAQSYMAIQQMRGGGFGGGGFGGGNPW